MQTVVLVVVAAIVALVALDGIARMSRRVPTARDQASVSTQKIIVDLTKRR